MAPRLKCGWIATALLTILFLFRPEAAQSLPVPENGVLVLRSYAAPPVYSLAFFRPRFRGHFANRRPFARRRAGPRTPRHFWTRNLHKNRGTNTVRQGPYPHYGWRRQGEPTASSVVPPRNPGGDHPRFPRGPGGRSNWVWGGNLWNGAAGASSVTILGAGGNRPPIAPRFTGTPGQNPAQISARLLNNKRHRPRELLAEVRADTPDSVKEAVAQEYGVEIDELGVIGLAGVRVWHLTMRQGQNQNLRELLTMLLQDGRVLTAQPDYIYTPVQGPAEEKETPPQGAALSPSAGKHQPTGMGVKLAVIDTCVERNHNELQGSVTSSFDAVRRVSGSCKPEDHGTAVASLIAGHYKLHGTAEGATLLSAQAFTFSSEENEIAATSREIALAMDWAATQGAQVMNLSFAGPADPLIERVVAAAYRKGIGLVAAAGNAGPASPPLYPAAYPEVIAVTATNGKRQIYSAANRGKYISVSARGVDVLAAHVNNTYGMESGTSFAAAEVSGVVASLLEKRPKAGPEEIRAALQETAAAVPGVDRNEAGFGLVNPAAAVAFVETSLPQ